MPRGIMVVQSSPVSPDRDDEFNKWYDEEHVPEMLALAGFTTARRYRLFEGGPIKAPAGSHSYLALYEVEADDLQAALTAMRTRPKGRVSTALALDRPPVVAFYELLTETAAASQGQPA
jgi:hypothetical protein